MEALMLKEEILERSRNEKADEGMENAENQGRKIGFIAFVFMFLVLIIYNIFLGQLDTFYALSALFWVFLSVEAYGKYRFAKKQTYLVITIAGAVASLASLANHVIMTLNL
jgi:hypothetical protein